MSDSTDWRWRRLSASASARSSQPLAVSSPTGSMESIAKAIERSSPEREAAWRLSASSRKCGMSPEWRWYSAASTPRRQALSDSSGGVALHDCSPSAAAASGAPRSRARCAASSSATCETGVVALAGECEMANLLVGLRDDLGEPAMALAPSLGPRLGVHRRAGQGVSEPDSVVLQHEHSRVERRREPRARIPPERLLEQVKCGCRERGHREQGVSCVRRYGIEALPKRLPEACRQGKLERRCRASSLLGDPCELEGEERIASRDDVDARQDRAARANGRGAP